MAHEEYRQLRQKLTELYAGRRMAGEPGLTAAGLQLLRRVENLEALSFWEPGGACDMGDVLAQLALALVRLPSRPAGWLRAEPFREPLPVGLGPKALNTAVLNLVWLLEQAKPRTISLRLERRPGAAHCLIRAAGNFLPRQPGQLYPVGRWPESLSDRQLALAAAQAILHRAGGGLVLGSGACQNAAAFWLPLRWEEALLPSPTAGELIEDRFSPVNVILGFTNRNE